MVNLIELTWTAYARLLVPAQKGSVQYEESRKAFYAGAQTVMDACKKIGEPVVSEEAGEMVLMLIEQELAAFSDVMTKKAKDKTETN